ncbi:L-lactate dehydrogenase [Cupriavidus sp. U2]|nr:L-lactate dehydrogenase [Cupriavidus sp. U2]
MSAAPLDETAQTAALQCGDKKTENASVAAQGERQAAWLKRRVLSLKDFEPLARKRLPKPLYAYVSGAVEDNITLAQNRQSFEDLALRPRVLVGVSTRDMSFNLFGRQYAAPFGLAPMGISALFAYRGDVVMAEAASQARVPAIMSGSSLIRLEEVMEAAPGTWF